MSNADANKALLEIAYRLWHETKGGSVDHWMTIVSEDIRFGSLAEGVSPVAFTALRTGKAEMKGYFAGLLAGWRMIHYTIHHMVAEGDRVAVICSTAWTNRTTGKVVETPKVDVWRFRDGKGTEFYEYYDTAKLLAAATP